MQQSDDTAAPATEAAAAPPAPARTVGERLRAGRGRTGLSVPAAAEKLHLDNRVIEALEADRFAELGAPVYVRGHLKRYADFVGENGVELVNLYNARETRQAPPDLTQVPHPERRADPRRLVTPLVVVGSAAVLLAAIWWVLSGSRPDEGASTIAAATGPAPTLLVPADDPATATLPANLQATPATLTSSMPVSRPESEPVKPATAEPAPIVAATESAPTPARETRLDLELPSDTWVEVYDSRDELLYADVASAGKLTGLTGRPPLRVVLGIANGVTVRVNGEPREIPGSAIEGEGARFVVNRSGTLSRAR
jgi:cytoskeletal protein RodZ